MEFCDKVNATYKNAIGKYQNAIDAIHIVAKGKDTIKQLPDKEITVKKITGIEDSER